MQRVRPCPTAEQIQQKNESDTTMVGIRYAHSEQRVCVEVGYTIDWLLLFLLLHINAYCLVCS